MSRATGWEITAVTIQIRRWFGLVHYPYHPWDWCIYLLIYHEKINRIHVDDPGMVYFPTFTALIFHKKSTIHVGKCTVRPMDGIVH